MSLELKASAEVADTYRLVRCIGEGGMGQVWAAEHMDTGEEVALKFIKGDEIKPNARRRFFREARAATAVSHPCIVKIREILRLDDDVPVLVMEHLRGESLAQKLDREGAIELEEVAAIVQPVVSAVGTAHSVGIVHRDLKPENIFLAEGEDGLIEVKVLDFGIAKLTAVEGSLAGSTSLTGTGSLLGTPYYMAPEQICGEKDIDHHADIWALGIIIYEALSGVLPTDADNVGQVFKLVVTSTLRPLEELAPELPKDITTIVGRMLSRRVTDRPDDLREVWRTLRRYTNIATDEFEPPTSLRPDPSGAPVRVGGGVKISIADEDTEMAPASGPVEGTGADSLDPASARTVPDEGALETLPDSERRPARRESPEGNPSRSRGLAGLAVAAAAIAIFGAWWATSTEPVTALAGGAAHAAATVAGSVDPGDGDQGTDPGNEQGTDSTGGDTEPASASAKPTTDGSIGKGSRTGAPPISTWTKQPSPKATATATAEPAPPTTTPTAAPAATEPMPDVQDGW